MRDYVFVLNHIPEPLFLEADVTGPARGNRKKNKQQCSFFFPGYLEVHHAERCEGAEVTRDETLNSQESFSVMSLPLICARLPD